MAVKDIKLCAFSNCDSKAEYVITDAINKEWNGKRICLYHYRSRQLLKYDNPKD